MSGKKKILITALMCTTGVIALIIGYYLGVNLVEPVRSYQQALAYLQEDAYDEAISIFSSLSESGNTNSILARIGGFDDAASRVISTQYEKAGYLREQGDYEGAIALYEELGDYQDAQNQANNTLLLMAQAFSDEGDYQDAIAILEELGDYDGGSFGEAGEILDQVRYTYAGRLEAIGKLEDAEEQYALCEAYSDAYENLREVRYNIARNALLISDFDTAKEVLEKLPSNYEDTADLLEILESVVDKVYVTDYTDVTGASTSLVSSYLWVHSVIVPGRTDEGISVKMQEDLVVGDTIDTAYFGAGTYDYTLEQVQDAQTWFFTYYGSETEDADGAIVLEASFSEDYGALTTKKVYVSTRDTLAAEAATQVLELEEEDVSDATLEQDEEGDSTDEETESGEENEDEEEEDEEGEEEKESSSKKSAEDDSDESEDEEGEEEDEEEEEEEELAVPENDRERSWIEVDDESAELVREGFRTRMRVQLAENGNMAFYNYTDDARLTHYCSVSGCLNKGESVLTTSTLRSYYCSDHYDAYVAALEELSEIKTAQIEQQEEENTEEAEQETVEEVTEEVSEESNEESSDEESDQELNEEDTTEEEENEQEEESKEDTKTQEEDEKENADVVEDDTEDETVDVSDEEDDASEDEDGSAGDEEESEEE